MYYKSIRIRLFPTLEQEELMWKHIYASRFIWNYMLNLQEEYYKNDNQYISLFDMNKMLKPLKRQQDYIWLKDVSARTLQRVCGDLNDSYQRYFNKQSRHPQFKSRKKSKNSFPVCDGAGKIYFENNYLVAQKIGRIKTKCNYKLPQGREYKISNPRISYVNNKWILSYTTERENQTLKLFGKMGIDLGMKELATVSFNDEIIVFHNINKTKRIKTLHHKLIHLQRKVHRKYHKNGNYNKTLSIIKIEKQISELYYRINNIRKNYLHQTTHFLISKLPEKIVMEDLNVKGMLKNRHLSKAISEQCFYEFIRQMKYKSECYGINFIQANKFYPSSKTCSCCGNIKHNLRLDDRTYICDKCGFIIDRDYNAAINLMNYST